MRSRTCRPAITGWPYALGIDRDGKVWYSSEYMDVVGRLDPDTGKVVEYPFTHAENSLRDFFMDDKGRMWFGSPANDKVGYFFLAGKWTAPTPAISHFET
jgi:streptogramin lyase